MAFHSDLALCIDCTLLPETILNKWSSVEQLLFLHEQCPTYGSAICTSSSPIDVPCVAPAYLSQNAASAFLWITVIGLIAIYISCCILHRYKRTRTMHASSPVFLALGFFLGGPLVMMSVILSTRNTTTTLCMAQQWCLHIGVTLILTTLILKNYRLHFIFNRRVFGGWQKPPTDCKLVALLLLVLLPDIIVLTFWTLVAPPSESLAAAGICESSQYNVLFHGLLYSMKVPQLVGCAILSWSLRKLHDLFNESVPLRFIVINIIIVTLPIAILAMIGADGNKDIVAARIATGVGLLYVIVASTAVILIPRFRYVRAELIMSSKSRLMRQPSGLLPGFSVVRDREPSEASKIDKEGNPMANNGGNHRVSGFVHVMPAGSGGTTPRGSTVNGMTAGFPINGTAPSGGYHARSGSGTLPIPFGRQHSHSTLGLPPSPAPVTTASAAIGSTGNNGGGAIPNLSLPPIHSTVQAPPRPVLGAINGAGKDVAIPLNVLSLEAVIQVRLQRKTNAVNHLDAKVRELKKSLDAAQTEYALPSFGCSYSPSFLC
jgi:hypothetical protein